MWEKLREAKEGDGVEKAGRGEWEVREGEG